MAELFFQHKNALGEDCAQEVAKGSAREGDEAHGEGTAREFGYKPEEKIQKSDPGPVMMKKRLEFARLHLDKSPEEFYSARRFRFLLPLLVRYKQEDAPNHFKWKS